MCIREGTKGTEDTILAKPCRALVTGRLSEGTQGALKGHSIAPFIYYAFCVWEADSQEISIVQNHRASHSSVTR